MPQRKTSLASLIFLLCACSSRTPRPEVAPYPSLPEPTETTTNRISSAAKLWEFIPSEQSYTYQSVTNMIVHEISTIRSRTDTLKLNTRFRIKLSQRQNSTIVSGYIDSVLIEQAARQDSEVNNATSEIGFGGEVTDARLTLKLATNQPECSSPLTSILGEIRPIILFHPTTLSLTSVWTDSVSASSCSGAGIPTTLKIIRSYRVLGETTYFTTQVVVLERTETASFNGAGSQTQHQVEITGMGTGSSRIYLDKITGNTIAVESIQKIDAAIKSSGRLQHFVQDITQKIKLVP